MKIAYKLFPCGRPLYVHVSPASPPPPRLLSSGEYHGLVRTHPAVELMTRSKEDHFEVLALPALEWRHFLGLQPSSSDSLPREPRLESFALPEGGSVLLPARTLPWTTENLREGRSTLDRGLVTTGVDSEVCVVGSSYQPDLDRRVAETCEYDGTLAGFLQEVREMEVASGVRPAPLPSLDLWLDLLRCAGPPPSLESGTEGLLTALVPALRFLARGSFDAEHVSNAIAGFSLWLRALCELGITRVHGNDLFALWDFALPLIAGLVYAEEKGSPELSRRLAEAGGLFEVPKGQFAGLAFLEGMRASRGGALLELRRLGQIFLDWD